MADDTKNKVKIEQIFKRATKSIKSLQKLFNSNLTSFGANPSKKDQKNKTPVIAPEETKIELTDVGLTKETDKRQTKSSPPAIGTYRARKEIGNDLANTQMPEPQTQQIITNENKVQSQKSSVNVSAPIKAQRVGAPKSATEVSPLKPPSPRTIEEDRIIRAKKDIARDTTVTQVSEPIPQRIIITDNKIQPQRATLLDQGKKELDITPAPTPKQMIITENTIRPQRATLLDQGKKELDITPAPTPKQIIVTENTIRPQRATLLEQGKKELDITPAPTPKQIIVTENTIRPQRGVSSNDSINKSFEDLDKMLESFSKGSNPQHSKNNSKFKSELNEVKKLIETFEKEAINSKPKFFDIEMYNKMYDMLPKSEQLQTSRRAFLKKAEDHQLNKVARSIQNQIDTSAKRDPQVSNNHSSNKTNDITKPKVLNSHKAKGRGI